MNTEPKYPEDPAWIEWLEERHAEAIAAQDAEMEKKRDTQRDYWLKKTAENGEMPC